MGGDAIANGFPSALGVFTSTASCMKLSPRDESPISKLEREHNGSQALHSRRAKARTRGRSALLSKGKVKEPYVLALLPSFVTDNSNNER